MEKVLLYFVIKYQGNWDKVYEALEQKEKVPMEELHNIEQKLNYQYITILSSKYPISLKAIYKPPFVIFYEGNLELVKYSQKIIAMTGAYNLNAYIKKVTENITRDLINNKKILLTTFNLGVELLVQEIINQDQSVSSCVGVINSNIKLWTPEQKTAFNYMRKNQLVISEYPFDLPADVIIEPNNRILLGLARTVLILPYDGEMTIEQLASDAFKENKDVLAVPNQIYEYFATNNLIKNHAKLIQDINDIL